MRNNFAVRIKRMSLCRLLYTRPLLTCAPILWSITFCSYCSAERPLMMMPIGYKEKLSNDITRKGQNRLYQSLCGGGRRMRRRLKRAQKSCQYNKLLWSKTHSHHRPHPTLQKTRLPSSIVINRHGIRAFVQAAALEIIIVTILLCRMIRLPLLSRCPLLVGAPVKNKYWRPSSKALGRK